jgi:hypothetical protein
MTKEVMNLVGVSVIQGKEMGPIEEGIDFRKRKTRERQEMLDHYPPERR